MISSYFKIALRNLLKYKGYSFINIFGLATGMAVAILIGLWVFDELSFNQYHKNYKSIAKVMRSITVNGETYDSDYVPYALGKELRANYDVSFKNLAVAWTLGEYVLSSGEVKLSRKGEFIEPQAPEMFSLKMLKGSWDGLKDPHSILLSESSAKALFGGKDPLNQLVKINNKMDVKVTGIYEDLPLNTQLTETKFFAPLDLYIAHNEWIKEQGWTNNFVNIYAQIQTKGEIESNAFESISAQIKEAQSRNESGAYKSQFFLHPMEKWHLHSDFKNGVIEKGPLRFVWLVGSLGVFILLLACINFMNLSTARSEKRSKEVGIRKAIGSQRGQLIIQFFSESFLIVIFAFLVALLLANIALPFFNNLATKQITMPWSNLWFWLACVIFISFTSIVAGIYPAFYLSSFQTIKVLKGTLNVGHFVASPRKFLVVFQFIVSITLILNTIVIYKQIIHTKNRPVGYTRNGLLMIEKKTEEYRGKYELLRTGLKNTGAVIEMSESEYKVTENRSSVAGFGWKGKNPLMNESFSTLCITPEYGKTIGWQMKDGRDFSREFASDSSGIIINEAAGKYMGLKNPVGQLVEWKRKNKFFTIIGVSKDMVTTSPYDAAVPTIFSLEKYHDFINIRLNPAISAAEALPKIESVFKKYIPSVPFEYEFADLAYNQKFANEERIGRLAFFFTIFAIFISCLGLFGLSSFMAEQRTKEIGIRKVLGATILDLWSLLSKDFMMLIMVSFIIAIPIAYNFMNNWVQKYSYRVEISWWIFIAAGLGTLLITLLTVSYQSIKAALMNPVKSLKTE